MSGIQAVSSAAGPILDVIETRATPSKRKITGRATVNVSKSGKKSATATVSGGVTVKDGPSKSTVNVKVNDKGRVTATVGQEVTIPVGDAKVKLGAKVGRSADLDQLVRWFFCLFGKKAEK